MRKIKELIDFKIELDNVLKEQMQTTAMALGKETILFHPLSGNSGRLVDVKNHPQNGKILIIELLDGRQYFAPAGEFIKMKI